MKIDNGKLGNMEYGNEIVKQLKEVFIGQTIIDVTYSYFSESFSFILSSGESVSVELYYE